MNTTLNKQQGVGLIEAMLALAVLVFSLGVSVSVLSESISGMQFTKIHLDVDSFSDEVAGILLADSTTAKSGALNVLFTDANPSSTATGLKIAAWRDRVDAEFNAGASQIQCSTLSCDVTLRWSELVDGAWVVQTFELKIPV